jgi:HlyD family secretion protein
MLRAQGASALSDFERAERELGSALARRAEAAEHLDLLETRTPSLDVAVADAQLKSARANVAIIEAEIEKTYVRSPIAGTVLKRLTNVGQSVSTEQRTPLFVVGDVSRLNVRAEIDEIDVARVSIGQQVFVTADAFPDRRFPGTVKRVGSRVALKSIESDRPGELQDRKVLEAIVSLDDRAPLPVGLRVDVFAE